MSLGKIAIDDHMSVNKEGLESCPARDLFNLPLFSLALHFLIHCPFCLFHKPPVSGIAGKWSRFFRKAFFSLVVWGFLYCCVWRWKIQSSRVHSRRNDHTGRVPDLVICNKTKTARVKRIVYKITVSPFYDIWFWDDGTMKKTWGRAGGSRFEDAKIFTGSDQDRLD